MEKTHFTHGEACWLDLAGDLSVTAPFYSGLFGWELVDGGEQTGHYHTASLMGGGVAGLMPAMQDGPSDWHIYFKVDDIDEATQRAQDAGGAVAMSPMQVMDMGRMGAVLDPEGTAVFLWEPDTMKGFGRVDDAGTFTWAELACEDPDALAPFYAHLFGWELEVSDNDEDDEEAEDYWEFKLGLTSAAGAMRKPASLPEGHPSYWSVYFFVDDAAETLERATALGASVLVEPTDISVGCFAVLKDPQGAVFNVLGPPNFDLID